MAEEIPSEGTPGSGKSPLVAILLLTNTVALGVVAFLQFKAHQREAQRPSVEDLVKAQMKEMNPEMAEAPELENEAKTPDGDRPGNLFPLDNFVANLAQGDGPRRFLRMQVVLKMGLESKEEEFKARQPQIRDVIIGLINTKRPEDLLKHEGRSYLKEEIKAAINSFLVDGQVTDVYYVQFQIN